MASTDNLGHRRSTGYVESKLSNIFGKRQNGRSLSGRELSIVEAASKLTENLIQVDQAKDNLLEENNRMKIVIECLTTVNASYDKFRTGYNATKELQAELEASKANAEQLATQLANAEHAIEEMKIQHQQVHAGAHALNESLYVELHNVRSKNTQLEAQVQHLERQLAASVASVQPPPEEDLNIALQDVKAEWATKEKRYITILEEMQEELKKLHAQLAEKELVAKKSWSWKKSSSSDSGKAKEKKEVEKEEEKEQEKPTADGPKTTPRTPPSSELALLKSRSKREQQVLFTAQSVVEDTTMCNLLLRKDVALLGEQVGDLQRENDELRQKLNIHSDSCNISMDSKLAVHPDSCSNSTDSISLRYNTVVQTSKQLEPGERPAPSEGGELLSPTTDEMDEWATNSDQPTGCEESSVCEEGV